MNRLVRYLDQVKAEGDIKEKTGNFVRNAIDDRMEDHRERTQATRGRRNYAMKKLITAVASMAACALLLIGGYSYYNTPVNYVSFDINPSVELGVNAFNRVVTAKGINADGQALLQQNRLRNMSVEDCLQALVQEAAQQGYVKEDGSTVIALTALSDNNDAAMRLQDRSRDRVRQMLQEQDMDCVVYADCSNLQIREQAREQDLSPGKCRLISILQDLDPSITFDQYRNARITDIIAKANELMQTSGASTAELERTRAMIGSAAQQLQANQARNRNRQQNQYQDGTQSGDQTQLRTQNQNQFRNGTQAGDQQQNQVQNQYQNQFQGGTQAGDQQQNQVQNQNSTEDQGQYRKQTQQKGNRS
ncbi:MAG: hypothetical protein ABRQ24_02195 [Syntrophomonadaceae bacterium]